MRRKYTKIVMLARNQLHSIEMTISQVLIDSGISHKECATIINEVE